jgi:glyoxylase-like metal-dependent hydrolase (beta-lactamase superfamily II)
LVNESVTIGAVHVTAICDVVGDFPVALDLAFPGSSGRRGSRTDDGIPRHSAGPTAGGCWIGAAGRLPQELAAAGLAPDEVELVFLTHLHLDHVGGTWPGTATNPGRGSRGLAT